MPRFRIVFFFLTLLSVLNPSSRLYAETNTNQCIVNLGGIQVCQDRNVLGLPNDIQACCDGVRQLADNSCHCNPAIDNVLGEEGQKIYKLEAICRIVQPLKWLKTTPMYQRKCEAVTASHEYGCEKSDVEIDGERFGAIVKYQKLFDTATDETVCLKEADFTAQLKAVFTPDVNFNVPYGVGTYTGYRNVAEYLGMDFAGMTHGFWFNDLTVDTSKKARLEVSKDGSNWISGTTGKGSFLRGGLPYSDAYIEQSVKFRGCETQASDYTIVPTEGMALLATRYVQATDLSQRWGVEDICRYHTKYCAGNPDTQQYESEEACRAYIGSLPLYTKACGPNRPLAGHSRSCKFKHHFMIPANPLMHCAHIGPKGTKDSQDHLKCDDEAECSSDQGQDAWPPVGGVGEQTPPDVKKAFENSNPGYETEPFGCVIPDPEAAAEGHDHKH